MMGGAAFAATFAGGMAYFAWQKPSQAAQAQPQAAAQSCAPRPDGTQNCQPAQRSFAYYLLPRYFYGWSTSASGAPEPRRTQSAALTSNPRPYTSAGPSGTERGGFGATAHNGSFRTSAGG